MKIMHNVLYMFNNFVTNKRAFWLFPRQYALVDFLYNLLLYVWINRLLKNLIWKSIGYSTPWRSGANKAKNIDRWEPKAHSILVKCKTEHIWHMQRTINISALNESLLCSAKYTRTTFYTRSIKCSRVLVSWFWTYIVWYFERK